MLRKAVVAGSGWLWLALVGSGWLRPVLGGSGWLWVIPPFSNADFLTEFVKSLISRNRILEYWCLLKNLCVPNGPMKSLETWYTGSQSIYLRNRVSDFR